MLSRSPSSVNELIVHLNATATDDVVVKYLQRLKQKLKLPGIASVGSGTANNSESVREKRRDVVGVIKTSSSATGPSSAMKSIL